jgi:NAD(P)-dependent dehydrogenase (short-subunit alcohol dehydrogenase family)
MHSLLNTYAVTKTEIDMMVSHLTDELGPFGVRMNSIRPNIVETEMMAVPMQVDGLVNDYLEQMPLGRVGQPRDIAELVRFLLGPESSWITGIRVDIDGGMHLRRAASYEHLAHAFFGDEGTAAMLQP